MIRPQITQAKEQVLALVNGTRSLKKREKQRVAGLVVQWSTFGKWFPDLTAEQVAEKLDNPRLTLAAMKLFEVTEQSTITNAFTAERAWRDFEAIRTATNGDAATIGLTENDLKRMQRASYLLEVKLWHTHTVHGKELSTICFENLRHYMSLWGVTPADMRLTERDLHKLWRSSCRYLAVFRLKQHESSVIVREEDLLELRLCIGEAYTTLEELGSSEARFQKLREKII